MESSFFINILDQNLIKKLVDFSAHVNCKVTVSDLYIKIVKIIHLQNFISVTKGNREQRSDEVIN